MKIIISPFQLIKILSYVILVQAIKHSNQYFIIKEILKQK